MGVAAGIVVVVAIAAFAGAHLAGGQLAPHVSGTDTIDNPNYPGDGLCENYEPPSEEFGTPDGCGNPERVQRSLSAVAVGAVRGNGGAALLATLLLWPLVTGVVHGITEGYGGSVGETARAVAPAFLPALGRHAARPVAVALAAPDWNYPVAVAPLRTAAAEFAGGGGVTLLTVVVALTVAWQGYVLAGVATGRAGDRGIGTFVGLVAAAVVAGCAAVTPASGGATGWGFLIGLMGLVFIGIPELLLRHDAKWDLFGYRTDGTPEPKPWLVASRRLLGVLLLVVGMWGAGGLGYV